jgi:hypothetical protein
MKEYFSASRSYNDIEILALDKSSKNIFQPADPIIFPETPQIPAMSGAHLRNSLNLISQ